MSHWARFRTSGPGRNTHRQRFQVLLEAARADRLLVLVDVERLPEQNVVLIVRPKRSSQQASIQQLDSATPDRPSIAHTLTVAFMIHACCGAYATEPETSMVPLTWWA